MKHTQRRDFRWREFISSHVFASLAVFLIALVLDNTLRAFGVDISSWREALYSGLSGLLVATPFSLLLWRVGLVTGPQYLLGGLGLFVPVTILSILAISQVDNILIYLPIEDGVESEFSQVLASTAYVRLARSALLFPAYIAVFWFSYHVHYQMLPKSNRKGVEP